MSECRPRGGVYTAILSATRQSAFTHDAGAEPGEDDNRHECSVLEITDVISGRVLTSDSMHPDSSFIVLLCRGTMT